MRPVHRDRARAGEASGHSTRESPFGERSLNGGRPCGSDPLEPAWRDTVMTPPLSSFVKDGHLEVPTGPGWGVEMHEEEIAKHPYEEVWYRGKMKSGKRSE